jgi:hypothetical protein
MLLAPETAYLEVRRKQLGKETFVPGSVAVDLTMMTYHYHISIEQDERIGKAA